MDLVTRDQDTDLLNTAPENSDSTETAAVDAPDAPDYGSDLLDKSNPIFMDFTDTMVFAPASSEEDGATSAAPDADLSKIFVCIGDPLPPGLNERLAAGSGAPDGGDEGGHKAEHDGGPGEDGPAGACLIAVDMIWMGDHLDMPDAGFTDGPGCAPDDGSVDAADNADETEPGTGGAPPGDTSDGVGADLSTDGEHVSMAHVLLFPQDAVL